MPVMAVGKICNRDYSSVFAMLSGQWSREMPMYGIGAISNSLISRDSSRISFVASLLAVSQPLQLNQGMSYAACYHDVFSLAIYFFYIVTVRI